MTYYEGIPRGAEDRAIIAKKGVLGHNRSLIESVVGDLVNLYGPSAKTSEVRDHTYTVLAERGVPAGEAFTVTEAVASLYRDAAMDISDRLPEEYYG